MAAASRVTHVTFTLLLGATALAFTGALIEAQRPGRPSGPGAPVDPSTRDNTRRQRFTPDGANVDDEIRRPASGRPDRGAGRVRQSDQRLRSAGPGVSTINETTKPLRVVQRQPLHLRRGRDGGRRPRTDLQRAELPRMPPERRDRRRQPGDRAPHRPSHWRAVLRVAGRIADSIAGHAPRGHGAGGRGRRHPHVPDLDQHARASASSKRSPTRRCWRIRAAQPAGDARHRRRRAGARGEQPRRIGRFGWKDQHASLESFAADAYLNEMGITSPLLPDENTVSGEDAAPYDPVADPEDDGVDVKAFANFMRATKAPSRGPITAAVKRGRAGVHGRSAAAPATSRDH